MGQRWDYADWKRRFGSAEQLLVTRYNPNIIKAYYFKSIDMTIIANVLKSEIDVWRVGRKNE